jgi:hypothetical protein
LEGIQLYLPRLIAVVDIKTTFYAFNLCIQPKEAEGMYCPNSYYILLLSVVDRDNFMTAGKGGSHLIDVTGLISPEGFWYYRTQILNTGTPFVKKISQVSAREYILPKLQTPRGKEAMFRIRYLEHVGN